MPAPITRSRPRPASAVANRRSRHNRWHAAGHRPSFRLGRRGRGGGRPRGRGPPADRTRRTRHGQGTDPPRRQTVGRRRGRGARGAGAGVGDPRHGRCARRARNRIARTHRVDVTPSLAARLSRRHRRPTSRAVREPRRLDHVPRGTCRTGTRPRLGGRPLRRQGRGGPSGPQARGERADEVLFGPRARLGPPWNKDHRMALAATIVAG